MSEVICLSPVDGSEVARRATASGREIDSAIARARAAQRDWARRPLGLRIAGVTAMLEALLSLAPEVIPEITWQMGRPIRYGGEFRGVEERARYMLSIAESALAPLLPSAQSGFTRYVRREPAGLVLVIAPWNYPYLTAINSIVPALVSGSAVILKHAAQTILAGERFAQAARLAGLPDGLFTHLVLTHGDTERILSGGLVDHVNFTGSVAGGHAISRAVGGTWTSMGLELGGKDPAYVRPDANFALAVETLVDGTFFNSGQCCCGIERIYVHEAVYDRFVDAFVSLTEQYVLGNPLETATTLGPMAMPRVAEVVRQQTAQALAEGAKALIGGGRFAADTGSGVYLAPQVLTEVTHKMAVMREENFGPLVGIMKVASDAEAVALMNDSAYGLTASLWTQDQAVAEALGAEIETGTVFMNRCDYLDPGLAWTGVKDTGRGASLSAIGYESLTRPKSFHLKQVLPE